MAVCAGEACKQEMANPSWHANSTWEPKHISPAAPGLNGQGPTHSKLARILSFSAFRVLLRFFNIPWDTLGISHAADATVVLRLLLQQTMSWLEPRRLCFVLAKFCSRRGKCTAAQQENQSSYEASCAAIFNMAAALLPSPAITESTPLHPYIGSHILWLIACARCLSQSNLH